MILRLSCGERAGFPLPTPRLLLTGLALVAGSSALQAQDSIATDRPDVVESSAVVGRGRWQIEASVGGENDRSAGASLRSFGNPFLLRYGISEEWELRLETDAWQRSSVREAPGADTRRSYGFADIAIGAKWHTHDGDEARGLPAVAWLLHVDLPSGAREFKGSGLRPSLRVVAEWELPQDLSLGVMPGVLVDRNDGGQRYTAPSLAVVLGRSWSDRCRSFVELAVHQATGLRNGGTVATLDLGTAYLLTQDMQVDAAVARGLNRQTADWGWTLGFSIRF